MRKNWRKEMDTWRRSIKFWLEPSAGLKQTVMPAYAVARATHPSSCENPPDGATLGPRIVAGKLATFAYGVAGPWSLDSAEGAEPWNTWTKGFTLEFWHITHEIC
ncbi:hypothetical protein QAD02_002760 [Eretmocerus hayati]|uniref:Uncharacterized protein n=1 Tax=Eretmocerus hayati TaxID=131215 RepID=A0ACC2NLJ4_9HYME|nr:hypothetical protein QAD02_002760 [Eretmocerus hayati]